VRWVNRRDSGRDRNSARIIKFPVKKSGKGSTDPRCRRKISREQRSCLADSGRFGLIPRRVALRRRLDAANHEHCCGKAASPEKGWRSLFSHAIGRLPTLGARMARPEQKTGGPDANVEPI
jgi:hypothetical protein